MKNKLYFKPHSVSANETIIQISFTLTDNDTTLDFHYHQSYDAIPSETGWQGTKETEHSPAMVQWKVWVMMKVPWPCKKLLPVPETLLLQHNYKLGYNINKEIK